MRRQRGTRAAGQVGRRAVGSVRVRVTATALLAVAVAVGVAAFVVNAGLDHDRNQVLIETATEEAHEVVAFNPDLRHPIALPSDANPTAGGLVEIVSNGHILAATRRLSGRPPLWDTGDPEVQGLNPGLGFLPRDSQVVAIPVTFKGGVKATVVVITSLAQFDHTVADVRSLLEVGTPMMLAVVGLICWVIVGRALRPIELMRREVAEVATVAANHRVAEPPYDDEVGRLARTLNSMLDRIQASTDRERRFVSDASHELRSPIANIRTELEVAMHRPELADWPQVAGEVLAQNERMEHLVTGLLLLARSDEGSLLEAAHPTDLLAIAQWVVGQYGPGAELILHGEPAFVRVPPVYMERMLANLVDNARRFASTHVDVVVEQDLRRGVARLRVRDDGAGVPETERTRIFERFVRLDESRRREGGGFGLGLAIVADLSHFYGGSIFVHDAAPGAEFVLTLPAAPAPNAPVPHDEGQPFGPTQPLQPAGPF